MDLERGFADAIQHLIAAGCIADEKSATVFTFRSPERWAVVCRQLQRVWGWSYWSGPKLITLTLLKDGTIDYQFSIKRRDVENIGSDVPA